MKEKSARQSDWEKDYLEFAQADQMIPPGRLTEKVFQTVRRDLNPSGKWVFGKVGLVHLVTGVMTLLFCPQFGIGWTESSHHFFHSLQNINLYLCSFVCGSIFLGSGSLVSAMVLRPEEFKILRSLKVVHFPLIALLGLAGLLFLRQAEFTWFEIAFWLVGGLGTMFTMTAVIQWLKSQVRTLGRSF